MIYKLIIFLICIQWNFFESSAHASNPLETIGKEILESKDNFIDRIANYWHWDCDIPNENQSYFQDFYVNALYNGLKKIERINPAFIRIQLARKERKKLPIKCKNNIKGAFAAYQVIPFTEGKIFIRSEFFKPFKEDISILKDSIDFLDRELERRKLFDPTVLERDFLENNPQSLLKKHPFFMRYTFTHEFLHYLNFNNLNGRKHEKGLLPGVAETDLVYSCAAQAYPYPVIASDYFERNDVLWSYRYPNTIKACTTCATAVLDNNKIKFIKASNEMVIDCKKLAESDPEQFKSTEGATKATIKIFGWSTWE